MLAFEKKIVHQLVSLDVRTEKECVAVSIDIGYQDSIKFVIKFWQGKVAR